jgi:ribosomal protein S12 methylthiotransferase accessory factor YcaO
MELSRDVTFEEDVAYQTSKHIDNDSDDSQELLASPSPPTKKETMEDDVIESIDLVDPVVQDPVPKDTVVLGQKRRPSWDRQTFIRGILRSKMGLLREIIK